MVFFISCGKFDKKLLIIYLVSALMDFARSFFYLISHDYYAEKYRIERVKDFLFIYIGLSLGIFIELIRKKNSKKKIFY